MHQSLPKSLPRDITAQIIGLERDILAATTQQLLVLQPKLHALLRDLAEKGYDVSDRACVLAHELQDDAVEAQFDNMPL